MKRIVALLLFFASACQAGELWQGTASGMAVDEVQRRFPAAATVEQPGTDRGSQNLLRASNVEIAGVPFEVRFYFAAGKLTHVRLSSAEMTDGGRPLFEKVAAALRSKYGPEISRVPSSIGIESTWMSGRTSILLGQMAITTGSVYLLYSEQVASSADKL